MIDRCANRLHRSRSLLTIGVTIAALAGCAVSPTPLSKDEISRRVSEDRSVMYAAQEPVSGPLDYPQVVARVMKYNLDFRLRMMESSLAQDRLNVGNFDMFPRLLASAGYVTRNNESGGRSVGIESGQETLANSSSVERDRGLAGLEFSWNLLDFGVSYYRARALADNALIAEERKRKVVQNLMQDTRITYWRALGAQRLTEKMAELMKRSDVALARARQIEQQGLLPQAQALAYQRALLDSTTLLHVRRQELEVAKAELAGLMNLPPNQDYTLVDTPETELPPLPADLEKYETLALEQRPELREEDYRKRISVSDARRALVSTLPGIRFDAGWQYDSNKYLYNNSWLEAGLRVSTDLFKLASIPAVRRAGETQLAVDDTRRLAQSVAVLTQVRVAAMRYGMAREELATVGASALVDQRLANFSKASASSRVDSELELIRTEARALLSTYQRQIAYANAQNAWGRLYHSLGLDLNPGQNDMQLENLSRLVGGSLASWHQRVFRRPGAQLAMRLILDGVAHEYRESVRLDLTESLRDQGIAVVDGPASLAMHVGASFVATRSRGTKLGSIHVVIRDAKGRQVGAANHQQRLTGKLDALRISAMARLAVDGQIVEIAQRLRDSETALANNGRGPSVLRQ